MRERLSFVHSGSTRCRTMQPEIIFSPSNCGARFAINATAALA